MFKDVLAHINMPLNLVKEIPTLSLNACYHLRNNDLQKDFFLKILHPERAARDRLQELNVQKLASAQQLSPQLIMSHHDERCTWMLMHFCEATTPASLLEQLPCLRQFHELECRRINQANPLDLAYDYLAAARKINANAPWLRQLENNLDQLTLPPISHLSLCHLDVHPGNFLMTQEGIYLIDFENAGLFDPLYDLAVLGFYLGLDVPGMQNILAIYKADFTVVDLQHCVDYQNICLQLFLAYLSYRLLYQGMKYDFYVYTPHPNPLPQGERENKAQKSFRQLIKTYYLPKAADLQKALEKELLFLGLSKSLT